jgi:hypothetical protein
LICQSENFWFFGFFDRDAKSPKFWE